MRWSTSMDNLAKRIDASVARIDASRARRLGELYVTQADDLAEPQEVLYDLAKLDPSALLREYEEKQAKFQTSPFDPDGYKLRFYPGGFTVWSGFPGAGKTTILRQFVCHLLKRGEGVFFASLEEHQRDLLIRIAGTAYGQEKPKTQQLQDFCDYYGSQLRIWGMIGISSHRKILSTVQALAKQGVTHAVIDSLMKLDIDSGDFDGQRRFANLLAAVSATTGVHIHLVAHPRKAIAADQDAHINDVGGAKEIVAAADNVLFIRRGGEQTMDQTICPMKISIRKQRHGTGAIGDVTGWFNRCLRQFKADQFDNLPTHYMPKEAY
jgi:twinkle protein